MPRRVPAKKVRREKVFNIKPGLVVKAAVEGDRVEFLCNDKPCGWVEGKWLDVCVKNPMEDEYICFDRRELIEGV
jgi:hypothetical protein